MGEVQATVAQAHRVPAVDGYDLAATVIQPGRGARDWVVVSCAFAVTARFYARYATALAEAGFGAVTYDYRGIGASRPASLRGFPATITDWALLDLAGVTAWVHATHAPRRLYLVGHSLGGILPGLMDRPDLVDAMVTVASENVFWRYRHGRTKAVFLGRAWLGPPLTGAFGYLPWSRFSRAEDLPAGAALQMAAAVRTPGGFLDDPTMPTHRYATFAAPVLAYSIEDDPEATRPSVDAMMAAYPDVERRHLIPTDAGLAEIGHFGYFRPKARCLWGEAISWLNDHPARRRSGSGGSWSTEG
jgi:predicted alpha/beta hydrolase